MLSPDDPHVGNVRNVIMPDPDNESWYFQEGRHFSTEAEPTALCRCNPWEFCVRTYLQG